MPDNPLHAYNHYSRRAASIVIREYSTSFSLASCLLRGRVRHDICNLYAVVRIADEIVDGVAAAAGLDTNAITAELDGFEQQVFRATRTGFSTNPAVHAFASTVHRCRISEEHIRAFFTSMRRDLDPTAYDQAALDDYIWGSAEVIGLM
ncbi:squalene/phytoene synthase family protein, partial [Corynebacterium durum]